MAGLFVDRARFAVARDCQALITIGHHRPGLGGALYVRDPIQSDSVETPTRARWGKVWYRVNDEDLSVFVFGAEGNGAADDTKALQAAIDACPAGGTLHLPSGGRFRITEPLRIAKPMTIRGSGAGSYVADSGGYVHQANPAQAAFILVPTKDAFAYGQFGALGVHFVDLAIRGAGPNSLSRSAIEVDTSVHGGDYHVRDCSFRNVNLRHFAVGYRLIGIVYLNRWEGGCVTECGDALRIERGRASNVGGQNRFFGWTALGNLRTCASLHEDTVGGDFAFFGCTLSESAYGIRANEKVQLTVVGCDFEALVNKGMGAGIYIPIVQQNPNSEGPKTITGNKFLLSDNDIWIDKRTKAYADSNFHWPMVLDGNYFGSTSALRVSVPQGHKPLSSPAFVIGASNAGPHNGRLDPRQISQFFRGLALFSKPS